MSDVLLQLDAVTKTFARPGKAPVHAVSEVSLEIRRGETYGLVGESGCGKTTLARIAAGLLSPTSGSARFNGVDLADPSTRGLWRPKIQMVFQDPLGSLNPRRRVGSIIAEPLVANARFGRDRARVRAGELAELVGLNPEHLNRYPAEFSGGQRQRVGLARALALEPELLICDEPVSALDVSIQAQVLNLLDTLQRDLGLTTVFISHNLSVVEHVADRVGVMYLGRVVEENQAQELFERPAHPYTAALLSAAPEPYAAVRERIVLAGDAPSPANIPAGCAFNPRCTYASDTCRTVRPELRRTADDGAHRSVACHHQLAATTPAPAPVRLPWPALRSPAGARPLEHRGDTDTTTGRSPWQLAWAKLRRDRAAIAAACTLVALVLFAAAAPLLAQLTGHAPDVQFRDTGLSPDGIPVTPNREFWFGTDQLGRDLFVRSAYGAQISLFVGFAATAVTVSIGTLVGLLAGYRGGRTDTVLSRFTDVMLGFPFLLTATALVAVFSPSMWITLAVIAGFSWTSIARVVRGQSMSLKEKEFVEAARAGGSSDSRIMRREILPNVLTPVIAYATLLVPSVIIVEATLSFLGIGIVPPRASWGSMIDDAVSFYSLRPTFLLFPSLLLFAATLAFNILGDSLREVLDPEGAKRGQL